jgi:YD repeat-containing protein
MPFGARFPLSLAAFLAPISSMEAQNLEPGWRNVSSTPAETQGFFIDMATGALSWNLPVAVIPGDIPIPLVYRFQASSSIQLAHRTTTIISDQNSSIDFETMPAHPRHEMHANLHFGYILPPHQDPTTGHPVPGIQALEDGTIFQDPHWLPAGKEGRGFPEAFGFKQPGDGIKTDKSRTWFMFDLTGDELGSWIARVPDATAAIRFRVLLNRNRARVFAPQKQGQALVPVLWLDRFGHSVTFHWQAPTRSDSPAISVQVMNMEGKGVRVSWPSQETADGIVDLLRMDPIGIELPSLRVQGYAAPGTGGSEGASSPGPSLSRALPAGRPVRVRLMAPEVPRAAGSPRPQVREWRFSYLDPQASELKGVLDPFGVTTSFEFKTYSFYHPDLAYRGVCAVESHDAATGSRHTQSWDRAAPTGSPASWSVTHTSAYADGLPTEPRSTIYWFGKSRNPGKPARLQALEIRGGHGNKRRVEWCSDQGREQSRTRKRFLSQATGQPEIERVQDLDPNSKQVTKEILKVDGREVQSDTYVNRDLAADPGQEWSTQATSRRRDLPEVQQAFQWSARDRLTRWAIRAGGMEMAETYAFDPEGRLAGVGRLASWIPGIHGARAYVPSALGPIAAEIASIREEWQYDDAGRIVRHTDPAGNASSQTYDLWGRPLSTSAAGSQSFVCSYPDELTRVWTLGEGRGVDHFDGFGRRRKRHRSDGLVEIFDYDCHGRLVAIQETNGKAVRWAVQATYDALDRLVQEQPATGPGYRYDYQSRGINQWIQTTATNGLVTTQLLDPWGQRIEATDSTGTTRIAYNQFGQVTQVTLREPGGKEQTRRFTYDGIGNLISQAEPESQTSRISNFNAFSQPGTLTDSTNRVIQMTYDDLGRVLEVKGEHLRLTNHYHAHRLVGRASSDGILQTFTYGGPGGRMDRETLSIDGQQRTLNYGYDPLGRLRTVVYPNGRLVGYDYDPLNRPSRVSHNGTPLAEVNYDEWGNRNRLAFASGAQSLWHADADGRRWSAWEVVASDGTERRTFRYDSSDWLTQAGEWNLLHDADGRLQSASGFGLETIYGHDGFGNNRAHSVQGIHSAALHSFSHDVRSDNGIPPVLGNGASSGWIPGANGETRRIGTGVADNHHLFLGWDSLGRLSTVTDSRTGSWQRQRYAPSGLRVERRDSQEAALGRQFFYTDHGLLLGEYALATGWRRDVIYLEDQAIAEVDEWGIHELHPDHLGSPRVITGGTSGTVEGRQGFGPHTR